MIGTPALIPFNSLGYHVGSEDFSSSDELEEFATNWTNAGFPLDDLMFGTELLKDGKNFECDFDQAKLAAFLKPLDLKFTVPVSFMEIGPKSGSLAVLTNVTIDYNHERLYGKRGTDQKEGYPLDPFNPALRSYFMSAVGTHEYSGVSLFDNMPFLAEADNFKVDKTY
jgi:hypothetical protein